jgi:hypothetical protein
MVGFTNRGVLLVGRAVDTVKVAIVPKGTTSSSWLRQREWGRAGGHKHNQVKRASNKIRFGRGANVRFHLACASVLKHLLLEARQRWQDFYY